MLCYTNVSPSVQSQPFHALPDVCRTCAIPVVDNNNNNNIESDFVSIVLIDIRRSNVYDLCRRSNIDHDDDKYKRIFIIELLCTRGTVTRPHSNISHLHSVLPEYAEHTYIIHTHVDFERPSFPPFLFKMKKQRVHSPNCQTRQ